MSSKESAVLAGRGTLSVSLTLRTIFAFAAGGWFALVLALLGGVEVPNWALVSTGTSTLVLLGLIASLMKQPRWQRPIGPTELLAVVYFVGATVVPIVATLSPVSALANPSDAMVAAILFSVTCGVALAVAAAPLHGQAAEMPVARLASDRLPGAPMLISLGVIGLVLRFPSIDSALGYFGGNYVEVARAPVGAIGLLSALLRPMLAGGLLINWYNRRGFGAGMLLLVGSLAAFASFSLNRAYIAAPVASFVIVYNMYIHRLRFSRVATSLAMAGIAFIVVGAFRTRLLNSQGGRYDVADPLASGWIAAASDLIQVYGQVPTRSGVVVQAANRALYPIDGILGSALSPIPGVSEEVRTASLTRAYNLLIYGRTGVTDQIIPSQLEWYWTFGLAGVLAWALFLGAMVRWLERRVAAAPSLVSAVPFAFGACWIAQAPIVSTTVLVQVLIYMSPTAIGLVVLSKRVFN